VINGEGEIVVLEADGRSFAGWPIATGVTGVNSPVVADLDGDQRLDVLVGSSDLKLTAYALDGSVLPRWPRLFSEIPFSTPFVADVDGDQDLDLVLGADDMEVRVLDLGAPARPGATPWPGFHGGADRRGVYVPQRIEVLVAPEPQGHPELARLTLFPARPNPFRASTELRFVLPSEERVTLEVFDVSGRRVASPVTARLLPEGAHSLKWDGTNAAGKSLPTGVYFLKLTGERAAAFGKVLRLD
jgi:hypothetical protein